MGFPTKNSYPKELWLVPVVVFTQLLWSFQGVFWRGPISCLLGDAFVLHMMSINYLDHGAFLYREQVPTLFQLPGYPFLIATLYDTFGRDARWLLGLQVALTSMLTPLLVIALRPHLGPWRWLFATCWILDIHHLLYTTIMTTEFSICWLWVGAWVGYSKAHGPKKFWGLVVGTLCLGCAAWIKPMSLYVLGFALPFWWIAHWKISLGQKIMGSLLALLIYGLTLTPLLLRNQAITGEFPRYCTISSFNIWYFNIPYYLVKAEGISVQRAREKQVELMRQHLNEQGANIPPIPASVAHDRSAHMVALGLNEMEYAHTADELAPEFFKQHGISYLVEHVWHGLKLFTVSNLSWLKLVFHSYDAHSFGWNPKEWVSIMGAWNISSWFLFCRLWELLTVGCFCALGLLGVLLRAWRKDIQSVHWMAMAFICYVPLVSGINVWGRFRFLIMPMLIFMAVDGLRLLWFKWKPEPKAQ